MLFGREQLFRSGPRVYIIKIFILTSGLPVYHLLQFISLVSINLNKTFQQEIQSLSKMPKRFAVVDAPPWKEAGIRRFTVKNYYVYYLIDDVKRTVNVLAVIYTGRDQEKQFS